MRGSFDSPTIKDGFFTLTGKLPAATSMDYPIHLGSISGGKATYESEFAGYEVCPLELGKEIPYRGVCPLDRSKWILYCRSAINPNEY
jgi:ribosomal protection tetracycline resistance protein